MSTITIPEIETIASKLAAIPDFQERKCGLIGRRTEMQLLLVCAVSKLHILYYGTPGVAKSMTVDGVRRHFPETTQFKTQAYKASPPEQFLGQISLKGMADDQYYRLIENKIPSVKWAIVDEIARAPRSLLPALQGMMVEREFDSGSGVQPVPLECMIGTVNDVPSDPELEAFFDRYTFKTVVSGPRSQEEFLAIMDSSLNRDLNGTPDVPDELIVTQAELVAFQEFRKTVIVPRSLKLKLAELWSNVLALDIVPSPRRWTDLLRGMQALAAIDGREECTDDDLQIAQHSLWMRPQDADKVYGAVVNFASAWVKQSAQLVESFRDTLDRLGQVQSAVAQGGENSTMLTIGDPADPKSEKQLVDHGMQVIAEHRKLRELITEHIRTATGQDVSQLEAILVQMDAAKAWAQDKLTYGLEL